MRLNKQPLNRVYYTTGGEKNVVYEIKNSNNGGAISQNKKDLNAFIPTIEITKTPKNTMGNDTVIHEKYYLDYYIKDGDIWAENISNSSVTKADTGETLIEYFLRECKKELVSYITNNTTVTADNILRNNKTGVPSWLFDEYNGDSKYMISVDNISDDEKIGLVSIIDETKNELISNLSNEFISKKEKETLDFQNNMTKKYNDFNRKTEKDVENFIKLLEKKFNIILSDDSDGCQDFDCQPDVNGDGIVDYECVVDRDFDHVEDDPCYNDSDNDGYEDFY